ncbi:MAG: polyribonucleotide nucleotidyltransferase [Planctomycetota bacterium]|jgi:polyribonucleotide nucleotidyltransferase|nr:MAG: polyribonucleotide nucleotidyltransferase [Planctomycetota bacterium]
MKGRKTVKVRVERKIGEHVLSIETGVLAKQAAGSVLVQYGETSVIVAAATGAPRLGIDFFPLTCDYRERSAATGKFPGGFLKREGRPTMKEILTSRLMDRPIRPLFPDGFFDEVQIQASVLSSDRQNDGDILAMVGASAALCISPLPFRGPLGSVRLAQVKGQFIPFPTQDQLEESDLDLIVSGSTSAVLMIEGFAREMPEDRMFQAIEEAHRIIRLLCEMQLELIEKAGKPKKEYVLVDYKPLRDRLIAGYLAELKVAKAILVKHDRGQAVKALRERAKIDVVSPQVAGGAANGFSEPDFVHVWHALEEQAVRELILAGTRPDGRDHTTLRPIHCEVDLLPRVHGSALFQRGETQALITVVLGTGKDEQRVDGLLEEYSKKFMLDYYFPSFSVGEVRPIRGPGRREIGHGALAERSIKPVLPDPDLFPYTIRVLSDILESNGSSSMASVCGATLGLMAAGVPISNPVAGISVGLVKQSESQWVLLTDILGDEDHYGDMDFKIAGSQTGITGIQLDLKIDGISPAIIEATLRQSREARLEILRAMLSAIGRPRAEISIWAPRLLRTHIDPEKIGLLIGPGGKTIRAIQESTGASIEVEDDGTVTVASHDAEGATAALAKIEALTASIQVGRIYEGRVTSIKDFGAFIELVPGKDGLCHVSELSDEYVSSVADVCKVGDVMRVKVIAVDDQDRVKLSRRAAMRELAESSNPIPS